MAVPFGIGGSVTPMTGEQATGNPSYFDALMRGLQGAQEVAKTVNTPRQLSENYLAAQLKNAHERTINKYLEPSEQARIANTQAQTGLYGEQSKYFGPNIQSEIDLRRAEANKANRFTGTAYSNLEKAMYGYDRIKQQYGEGSEQANQAKNYVQRLAEGAQGVTVYDPDTGQPMVQVGGPSKSGGRNGGGGGVYETQGGDQFTPVTGTTATKLQNRIIGEEQLKPLIQDIIKTVPQFQSGWKQLETKIEGTLNRWTNSDYRGPSTFKSGKAALSKSAESLINLFGLHANARNVEEVKNILNPDEDESIKGYEDRVIQELKNFAQSKSISQKQLRQGIQVNNNPILTSNNLINIRAKRYNVTPEKIQQAIQDGVNSDIAMKEWLRKNS